MESTMRILMRRREAAEMLGVSERTLARWHRDGVLRAVRMGPRLIGYDRETLRRFAQGGAQECAGMER